MGDPVGEAEENAAEVVEALVAASPASSFCEALKSSRLRLSKKVKSLQFQLWQAGCPAGFVTQPDGQIESGSQVFTSSTHQSVGICQFHKSYSLSISRLVG